MKYDSSEESNDSSEESNSVNVMAIFNYVLISVFFLMPAENTGLQKNSDNCSKFDSNFH